jgi:SagB-type dehydrogenase family enzyme
VPPATITYRRSPHIVCYWSGGRLVFHNFATGHGITANPVVSEVLHVFDDWQSIDALARALPRFTAASLRTVVADLSRRTFLDRSDRPADARVEAMRGWDSWNPAAGFLHFSTKDYDFAGSERQVDAVLRRRLREKPLPAPTKPVMASCAVPLPAARLDGGLARALRARRTWRRFSRRPISLRDLATLVGLTFGVQRWLNAGKLGRAPLKTSPSGGARHPIEAYVVARRVSDLAPGLYFYAPADHRLVPIRRGATVTAIERYLPGQRWYRDASALVVLTAVFARTQWQYPHARAYRAVLIEAGHLCQTFCLVATALDLAPFCSDALADTSIERDLKIDGVSESVLYAAGVGARPTGRWTPWPGETRRPARRRSK